MKGWTAAEIIERELLQVTVYVPDETGFAVAVVGLDDYEVRRITAEIIDRLRDAGHLTETIDRTRL